MYVYLGHIAWPGEQTIANKHTHTHTHLLQEKRAVGPEAQRACATSQDSCYRSLAENRQERLAKLLEARMASSPPPPWPLECYLEPHAGSRDMHWSGWKGQKRPVVIGSLATWIDLVGLDAQDLAACEVCGGAYRASVCSDPLLSLVDSVTRPYCPCKTESTPHSKTVYRLTPRPCTEPLPTERCHA